MVQTKTTTLYKIACTTSYNSLECYADFLVYDKECKLIAIRYGGYPEAVQGMADVIVTGCTLKLTLSDKNKLELNSKEMRSYFKRISHDGIYAEGLLFRKDDGLQSLVLSEDEEDDVETVKPNRNIYIFCKDDEELYRELDSRLSVPLIPEFKDYFITELKLRGIMERLTVIAASSEYACEAWHLNITSEESELEDILTRGLKSGAIKIPGAPSGASTLDSINTFTEYLRAFSTEIAERIWHSFEPLYEPEKEPVDDALADVNQYVIDNAGYALFDAQLGAAEAMRRLLLKDKLALLIAECGTGKTKIGAAALYAYQKGKRKCLNVVICPSHLTKKWVRELNETVPNCIAGVASSLYDIDRLHELYEKGGKTVYIVLSKETARNGYMKYPAVVWNPIKRGYLCPDCGTVQEMTLIEDSTVSKVNADQFFFRRETEENHKCQNPDCRHVLWSCLNPDMLDSSSEWVRIGGYGYVSRRNPSAHLNFCKDKKASKIIELAQHRDGVYPAAGAYRRVSLASYIKDHIKHLDGLICDEMHQYSGESAQGEAMAELAGISDKVIGLTATLINGYSKGLFYLLYRMKPYLMRLDGKDYKKPRDFCQQYGVVESVYQVDGSTYNASSKSHTRKIRERFLPGVSPLVYARFLLENCVFLSLDDMGKELPDYEEYPIPCWMRDEVRQEYDGLEHEFRTIMRQDKRLGKKLLSNYLNLLSAYPDQPYGHQSIVNPQTKEPLIVPKDLSSFEIAQPKDEAVLELVEEKIKDGERVIIYTAWTRLDSREKLHKFLTEKGYRVKILDQNIATTKREEWVDNQVKKGIDVLIVNPALVETGLDLNAFTTLIFYNIAFNLYIFRQAARRSYRINQTAPKVSVYMYYYSDTMQQRALRLMASKLTAATVIEGSISEEGLAAMSDCRDMMTELAKELISGIKTAGSVEDLRDSFQRMAINNGRLQAASEQTEKPKPEKKAPGPVPVFVSPQNGDTSHNNQISAMSFNAAAEHKKQTRKALETDAETGQLNLFDLLEAS